MSKIIKEGGTYGKCLVIFLDTKETTYELKIDSKTRLNLVNHTRVPSVISDHYLLAMKCEKDKKSIENDWKLITRPTRIKISKHQQQLTKNGKTLKP